MKALTKDEVNTFCKELWGRDASGVIVNDGYSKNYDLLGYDLSPEHTTFKLADLVRVAEFFGTWDVNIAGAGGGSGCDTCGYGSEVELTVVVRATPKEKP